MLFLFYTGLTLLLPQQQKTPIPTIPKEKEAELRKTYSLELSSKTKESVAKLLEDATNTKDDPVTRFFLLDLASKHARDISDFAGAFKAIDTMDEFHSDVSPLAHKQRILEEARKRNPKVPESLEALAQGDLALAISAADPARKDGANYDIASKSAENAAKTAKTLKIKALEDKAALVSKYAVDLGKDGKNPFVQARFQYFILGQNEESVLKSLSEGSDPKLKKLSGLKLLGGKSAENYCEYGDAAFEAANDSSRPAHEKAILQREALEMYTLALSTATGAAKTKYERDPQLKKRMSDLEKTTSSVAMALPAGSVDLLALIDPKLHKVVGEWAKDGPTLTGSLAPYSRIQIPYEPPEEYDLVLHLERRRGTTFLVGFPGRAMLALDGYGGNLSCLEVVDGKRGDQNETAFKGAVLADAKKCVLSCSVRKGGIAATLDDRKLVDWKGERSRLSMPQDWPTPNARALWLGCWDSDFQISRITLVPVSGQGKRLR